MLDCILMKLFKVNAVLPSLLYLRNLISCLLSHILRINSSWHLHYLQRIRLHKNSISVTTHLLSCQLFTSHHTVRSCLEIPSWKDLHTLSQLESQHLSRNWNSCCISKSILCEQTSSFQFVGYFLPWLFSVESWSESCKCSVIVMPSAPVIFGFSFGLEREIM